MARTKHVQEDAAPHRETAVASADAQPAASLAKKPKRQRRGRTSSERGRAFRKRQNNHEALLAAEVERLRQEVQDKQFLLSVCEAKYQRSRHSVHGLLVEIAVEYLRTFQFVRLAGEAVAASNGEVIKGKETCLDRLMRPNAATSTNRVEPTAALEQWRLHASASRDFSINIVRPPSLIGPDEHLIVEIELEATHHITPTFVDVFFEPPARTMASRLLQSCMDKMMKVSIRAHFQFSPERRINLTIVQADYVQGFLHLGLSLPDVANLLTMSTLATASTLERAEYPSQKACAA